MSGQPDPKSRSLARGERRYRRKVASPKQWQAIIAAKIGPCRVCMRVASNGGASAHKPYPIQWHHLVERDSPYFGDDVADNIVPVHGGACHDRVTNRDPAALRAVAESLSFEEYSYCVAKVGEDAMPRLFGVGRG